LFFISLKVRCRGSLKWWVLSDSNTRPLRYESLKNTSKSAYYRAFKRIVKYIATADNRFLLQKIL